MRFSEYIHILVLIAVATCCVQPVCAADEATTYYNTGEAYLANGDYERAIASFDMALASDTTMIKTSETLLYTYRDKSYAQIQLQRYDDAVSTTGQGLTLYPRDKMLWNNKGYANYNLGKYQEALWAYNTAIQYEPDYTIALINKGDTLAKMQDFRGAAEAYTRAMETDPGNTDAATRLSDAKQAAVPAPALSAENDTRAGQFYSEGVVFARSGQYAEAIAAYDKAIAINPNVTGAHQDRVIALEKLRQAQHNSATPVQQQTATTPLPQKTQQPTRPAPLSSAPAGAIILMAGIALWSRR